MKKNLKVQLGGRIKKRRNQLNLTRAELARRCKFNVVALSHYENGLRYPPPQKLLILAKNLNVSTDWLNFGIEPLQFKDVAPIISRPILQAGKLPVLNWRDILLIDGGFMALEIQEFEPIFEELPPNCFCIDVQGDAMISAIPFTRSFVNNTRLYIDPNLTPNPGDYVIAKIIDRNEAVFRQYTIDSGIEYLKPLNSQYHPIPKNENIQIIGVAIRAVDKLR